MKKKAIRAYETREYFIVWKHESQINVWVGRYWTQECAEMSRNGTAVTSKWTGMAGAPLWTRSFWIIAVSFPFFPPSPFWCIPGGLVSVKTGPNVFQGVLESEKNSFTVSVSLRSSFVTLSFINRQLTEAQTWTTVVPKSKSLSYPKEFFKEK